ncbi:30S ribosomal protein S8P [Aeropyrum pernix K1]|uniref:Small ribosomal subunit protein uS8 n=2 Tax=Aeropyrum pernix TaxID=56636 RepID=RS8_AERPE|nr:30S ribosomal protein S8 [Aeropyrum pernix]Q9YF89.2 RecName: Full=Small ribosomal subunit protein uS8; AltName: Full=30S ribosomal protein S8 [Aeropyrum pernix K1]BAA79307.2 30S ribosomal protein S8P [Aeropyrum pernix K1]
MVMLDTLANAMAAIKNAEMRGKGEAIIMPSSKLIANVLRILEKEGYIGGFEYIDDGRWGKFRVKLLGRINDIGVVKPRTPVSYRELAKMPEHLRKYLASRDVGLLILSTPQGVMTHREALKRKIGGIVIAYVY